MQELHPSWQNIADGQGWAVSATGMTIVFLSLVMVSLFIAALPHVMVVLNNWLPEATPEKNLPKPAQAASEDESIAVAAAYAYHNS